MWDAEEAVEGEQQFVADCEGQCCVLHHTSWTLETMLMLYPYCSREPSASPQRAATESGIPRTSTHAASASASSSYAPAAGASGQASSAPHEPTIREEATAVVDRSMRAHQQTTGPSNGNGNSQPKKSKVRMVGDWQLNKTLGAGSMGKVKLATNIVTKEKVGMKVLIRIPHG